MNRITGLMGCIAIVLLCSSLASSQPITDGFYTEVSSDSTLIGIGDIDAEGVIYGIDSKDYFDSLDHVINDPFISSFLPERLVKNLHMTPLMGSTSISDISNITVVPQDILEKIDTQNPFSLLEEVKIYSDVSLSLSDGMFLLGTAGRDLNISTQIPSCLSGFISFPLEGFGSIYSFFCLSEQNASTTFSYQRDNILIYPFSDTCTVHITSNTGEHIWNSSNENIQYMFFLNNESFSFTDTSSMHIFPVSGSTKEPIIQYDFIPSENTPDIGNLIQNIGDADENISIDDIPIPQDLSQQSNLLTSVSTMLNGGLLFTNHSGDVWIDDTKHSFDTVGFSRVDQATITGSPSNVTVEADYSLVFLGTYFYSSQASPSEQGVSIPLLPIMLWLAAIIVFIVTYKILKKNDVRYTISDHRIRYGVIGLHVIGYIVVFILVDSVLQYHFGISFIKEATLNGFTLLAGLFLLMELFLMVIGFLLAAFPLGIIVSRLLRHYGFDNTYTHLGKTVVAFSIWPFIALYLTMFVNIALMFFNPLQTMI